MWRRTWLVFSQAVTVAVACCSWWPRSSPNGCRRAPAAALPPCCRTHAGAGGACPAGSCGQGGPRRQPRPGRAAGRAGGGQRHRQQAGRSAHPHADDPRFRFFFGDQARTQQQQSGLGSGVIVSPEGYLLTNNHVVEGASEIEVQLADGRQTRAGCRHRPRDRPRGAEDRPRRLPVIAFGDVRALQVGDAVLAIGNPFNVGQTVTAGIVSALGRNRLGLSTFENFIQTDAAINPGNSGGALVDAQGNLVGINTAIFSRSGGSLGIGFAIPVDTARQVMEALVRDGQVRRGWIGVEPRDLTPNWPRAWPAGEKRRADHRRAAGRPGRKAGLRPATWWSAWALQHQRQPLQDQHAKKPSAASTVHLTMTMPRRRHTTWLVPMYIAKHSSPASSSRPKTRRKAAAHQAGASSAKPRGASASRSKLTTS
jgi:serine protease DegQ